MCTFHNSVGYQILVSAYDLPSPYDQRTTIEKIDKLLTLIEASDTLDRLFLVFDTLNILFDIIPQICIKKWSEAGNDILENKETCTTYLIKDIRAAYRNVHQDFDQLGRHRNKSFHGQIEDYPLYATIGHQPKNKKHFKKYFQLMSHILVACYIIRSLSDDDGKITNDKRGCLETIRTFANGEYDDDLNRLPEDLLTPDQYLQHLHKINSTKKIRSLIKLLRHSSISNRQNTSPEITHIPIQIRTNKNHRHDTFDDLADDAELQPSDPTTFSISTTNEKEIPPQAGYNLIIPSNTVVQQEDNSNRPNALAINNKRALANQQLPNSWNNLNQHDMNCLLDYLSKPTVEVDIDSCRTKAMLNLMFWAGMTSERIATLKFTTEASKSATDHDLYLFNNKAIRLKSTGPALINKNDTVAKRLTHSHQDYIELQLPDMAIKALNNFISRSRFSNNFLFDINSRKIISNCQKALRSVRNKTNSRLYVNHIQSYIQNQLSVTPNNDVAGAMLTLGKDIPIGRTKIHYTSLDADYLNELYIHTCNSILKSANLNNLVLNNFPTKTTGQLGTPLRPLRKPLKDLFHAIEKKLSFMRQPKTGEELIKFHNLYTAYSAWVVSFSTGHRNTKSPYIPEFEFDPQTGFTITRDKDTIDFHHSRIVWVADICRKQLVLYRQHLEALKSYSAFQSSAKKAVTADRFLFLRKTFCIEEFSYKKLAEILTEFGYALPLNTPRHYIKSELLEDGCNPDIIEIFLGHWETGQEAWGNYSSQFPYDYRKELQQYLSPLLARTGVKPLKGLTHSKSKHFFPQRVIKALNSPPRISRRKSTQNPPSPNVKNQPASLWFEALGKPFEKKDINETFTADQGIVLEKLEKYLPGLYNGITDTSVSSDEMISFLPKLKNRPLNPRNYYKRLFFLKNGLKIGKENLNWQVELFELPIVIKKTNNRARPQVMKNLAKYRIIEKAFLNDFTNNYLSSPDLRIGQIILSAILFGSLEHKDWTTPFLKGLGNDIYLLSNTLWIDLWDAKPQTDEDRFYQQNVPNKYRRWVADPFTQLLIYRWLKKYPEDRSFCNSLSAQLTLKKYLTHLKLPATPKIGRLYKFASARHTVVLPAFLGAYAEKQIGSVSLTDESWLRFITGELIPTTTRIKKTYSVVNPTTDFASDSQHHHLKTIKNSLNKKHDGIDKTIKYLDSHSGEICPILQLITFWAISLFQKKQSGNIECRQTKKLASSTISSYISAIAKPMIASCKNINPLVLDEIDLHTIYQRTIKLINKDKTDLNKICRLSQFHEFLVAFYNLPGINIFAFDEVNFSKKNNRVSANYLPDNTFENLLDNLGMENFRQIDRETRITIIIAILSFRTGLRRSEILGLRYEDLVGTTDQELIIKGHKYRKLKSASSQRRSLVYIFLKNREINFLNQWLKLRRTELAHNKTGILLTASPFSNKIIPDDDIIQNLISLLKGAFCDDTTVLHHGRHTFANNTFLAQTIRTDIQTSDLPQSIINSSALINSININQLIKPNSKKSLYLLTSLLGHASPATSMLSYVHSADWLLGHYLRHESCSPKLTSALIAKLIGCAEPRAYQIMNNNGYCLVNTLDNQGKELRGLLKHKLEQTIIKHRVSEEKTTEKHKPFDIILQTIKESGYLLPESADELDFLKSCYDKLISTQYQKRTMYINTALAALKTYKRHGKYIELHKFTEATRIIKLFDFLELPPNQITITHHHKREKDSRHGIKKWGYQLKHEMVSGDPANTLNINGCIRITYSNPQRWNCHFLELILLLTQLSQAE